MKWQGPGGSAGELAEMFKQDWMKLRPLVCEVSSLPHHPPACLHHCYLLDLFWGCGDVRGSAARGRGAGRPQTPPGGLCPLSSFQLSATPRARPTWPRRTALLASALSHRKPLGLWQNLCGHFIYCFGVFQAENLESERPFSHSSCCCIRGSVRVRPAVDVLDMKPFNSKLAQLEN